MESICRLILAFHKVLVESFWAFLQKLAQYGKLMEAYFDIQYGHDGNTIGKPYGSSVQVFQKVLIESLREFSTNGKHMEA